MGKILKYMTTIALAAVMLFGTMTTAFAVENSGQVVGNDQKGSITIHKYKMPDAENAFESNTENGGIEMDSLPETAEPLANVKFQVTKMEQDQAGKWNETTVSRTVVTNESGEAVLEDLPLGRYKVEELGLDSSDGSDAVLPNENETGGDSADMPLLLAPRSRTGSCAGRGGQSAARDTARTSRICLLRNQRVQRSGTQRHLCRIRFRAAYDEKEPSHNRCRRTCDHVQLVH